ncbi:MAG: DUF5908 family protein [Bacteroidia bacterium]|nr:DUF5908 family protein [Bacteroidia bacterium]
MPIEVKELIVRAWVDSQNSENRSEAKQVAKSGSETSEYDASVLEQLKKMLTDKKDR